MGVGIKGRGDLGVAEDLLHNLRVNVAREHERGHRVPQVVEASVKQPRLPRKHPLACTPHHVVLECRY